MNRLALLLPALLLALPAAAQAPPAGDGPVASGPSTDAPPARPPGPRRLGGPRTGITVLSAGAVRQINDAFDTGYCYDDQGYSRACEGGPRIDPAAPVVTQFGWQFETRMFQAESGLTGVAEWVLLAGGIERGLVLPSATFLVGARTPGGFEVGVGPNLSLSGVAYALAAGANYEAGTVSIPVNAAVVLAQGGPRLSLLVGLNMSESRY